MQLIFDRQVSRRTPGRFRTRVITDGVVPSLHVDYKNTRIKQYHKEGRALRTETTINNTRDFSIGKRLKNLPALRQIGFRANRRLLDVQKISHDCSIGEDAFNQVVCPIEVDGQRASALRFGDPRVQALFAVLAVFSLQLQGFTNAELRALLAQLLGVDPATYPAGRMTYDLRRLRLHGIIERIPRSHRYQLTAGGLRIALFFSRTYARLLRPSLAEIMPQAPPAQHASEPPLIASICHRRMLSGAATCRLNLTHSNLTDSQSILGTRTLASAPAVLDLYMWLSYRCFKAKGPESIPIFGQFGLVAQLGSVEYSRPRRFRGMLEQWLRVIRAMCQAARRKLAPMASDC